jgi:hypothetical protein
MTSRAVNRHMSRSLYWDVHSQSGHASYGLSWLSLPLAPRLNGERVVAIDYSPLVLLGSVISEAGGRWRDLTPAEQGDIDERLQRMVDVGLEIWD